MTSSHIDLLNEKEIFAWKCSSFARRLFWDTKMAAVSSFRYPNMAAVTSVENDLYTVEVTTNS